MTLPARRFAIVALLASGAALWAMLGDGRGMGPVRWAAFIAAIAIGAVPVIRRNICRALDGLRNPSQRATEITALAVGILATAYFVFTAFHQDRDLFPKTHDEGSYLLGMQMLAEGKLWMPRHELADFFDTFYVINDPVYASLYFPGTALLYAPSIWLNWPTWSLPVVTSGAIVGLLYLLVTKLVDGAAGLLAALLLASLSWYRMLSILLFSQVPMLLLGLLMVWAWLRWREKRNLAWLAVIGALAGWAAIVRPVDALCYALPIGAAIAWELRKSSLRHRAIAAGLIVLGAMPFLALQVTFNKGVTGRFLKTPYTFYLERDQPGTSFGFHAYDPSLAPSSMLSQKRDYYRAFMQPSIARHTPGHLLRNWIGRDDPSTQAAYARPRLPMLIDTTMPFRVLLPLALVGTLGLGASLRRWVLWLPLPLLVLAYLPNTFFLEHYAAVVAPAVIVSIVLGVRVLAEAWPRFADPIRSSLSLGLITLALFSTYEANPLVDKAHAIDDETFPSATLRFVNVEMPHVIETPAVVLFKYAPGDNFIEEPVYNNAGAWPDDQLIVRAHDLGPRNIELFRYYSQRQPQRKFYRFDRATKTLTPLGDAGSLLTEGNRGG